MNARGRLKAEAATAAAAASAMVKIWPPAPGLPALEGCLPTAGFRLLPGRRRRRRDMAGIGMSGPE
jgi:hypothetical protein